MLDLPKKLSSYSKERPKEIASLFDSIAKRYDRTNAWLSFGLSFYWSRRCVSSLLQQKPRDFIDLCGGTGEITRRLAKQRPLNRAVVVDFSPGMLEIARKSSFDIETIEADVCETGIEKESFDAAAMAYGIRNIKDRAAALAEAFRLLRPGGKLVILELTRPRTRIMRVCHALHLQFAVPLIGRFIAKNGAAYSYLSQSIGAFIEPPILVKELQQAGFQSTEATTLTGGIATLFCSTKSPV